MGSTYREHWRATAVARRRTMLIVGLVVALITALVPTWFAPASAATPISGTEPSYTLEGCRNPTNNLETSDFVCDTPNYTTGNLGKTWNELDLVPHRLTTRVSGSSQSVTYKIAVAVDHEDAGKKGYDAIGAGSTGSAPGPRKGPGSHASCTSSWGPEEVAVPGMGGADKTMFREITVTQTRGTTCVWDWWARLAIGASQYSGSSLHANKALVVLVNGQRSVTSSGVGAADVSIPVKEILPQKIEFDGSASRGSGYTWAVTKQASATSLSFTNTCAAGAPMSKSVSITVSWTKSTLNPANAVTALSQLTATNPSHRTIAISGSWRITDGTSTVFGPFEFGPTDLPPDSSTKLLSVAPANFREDSITTSATSVTWNASASYTDKVTGLGVPGQTSATLTKAVATLANAADNSAVVNDVESISGTGLTFEVAAPSVGSFSNYTAGTATTGPVNWSSGTVTSSGSVTFAKTVLLDQPRITSGTLTDTATVTGSTTGTANSSGALNVGITSTATVTLNVKKTIPNVLTGNETATFNFVVTGPNSYSSNLSITMSASDPLNVGTGRREKTASITGLAPGTYTVTEQADSNGDWATQDPVQATIALPSCAETATVNNGFGPATAQALKLTQPTTESKAGWEFKLYDVTNGANTLLETLTTTTTGQVNFQTVLLDAKTYRIVETAQTNWDLTSITGDVSSSSCQFSVNYPSDADRTFSCTFTNTKRGRVTLTKLVSGSAIPTGSPYTFGFSLTSKGPDGVAGTADDVNQSATANATNGGNIDFGYLRPATYTLCELELGVSWKSSWQYDDGNASTAPDGFGPVTPFNPNAADQPPQDLGTRCYTFVLAAGGSSAVRINNVPPPGGDQRTIGYWKNWNSVKRSADFLAKHEETHFIVDDFVPAAGIVLGNVAVTTVPQAVAILSNASTRYAEHGLAAQQLAAELNVAAGAAPDCTTIASWIARGDALLIQIGWSGSQTTTIVKAGALKTSFNAVHAVLDAYNNGTCPALPYTP